jgi:hypothetical protein
MELLDWFNRTAHGWGSLGVIIFASVFATIAFLIAAYVNWNPVEEVEDQTRGIGLLPESTVITAVSICERPDTVISEITSPEGHYFHAVNDSGSARYDLTWLPGLDKIAVEEQRGRTFNLWVEPMDAEFKACIAVREIHQREAGY